MNEWGNNEDYMMISSVCADNLTYKVRESIRHGYKIFGAPLVRGGHIMQAVVRGNSVSRKNNKKTNEDPNQMTLEEGGKRKQQ